MSEREVKVVLSGEDRFSSVFRTFQSDVARAATGADRLALSTGRIGVSAAQTAAAMRTVPAQITDALTQLQGGASPLTVLLQQGGQLKDSFGGIVPAAAGVARAVVGMVNPLTAGAVVASALAYAYEQGTEESNRFAKTLALTGNAAGTTVGRLNLVAKAVSDVVGTQGQAADAVTALAEIGVRGDASLTKFSEAAVRLARETGQPIKETISVFAELGKAPADASAKLNESMNFLTASTFEQIRALEQQGRTQEAARIAQSAYADAVISRTRNIEDRLGYLQSAWRSTSDVAKRAWDAMVDIGRERGPEDRLAELQAELDKRQARGPLNDRTASAFEKGNKFIQDQIDLLKSTNKENVQLAETDARRAAAQQAGIAAEQAIARIRDGSASKTQRLNKELEDYRRNLEAIRAVNPQSQALDPKKILIDEANIRDKYKEAPKTERQSEAQRYIETLQKQIEQTQNLTVYEQALADIETRRLKVANDGERELVLTKARAVDLALKQAKAQDELEASLQAIVRADDAKIDIARNLVGQTTTGRIAAAIKQVDALRAAMNDPEFQNPAMQDALVAAARKINQDIKDLAAGVTPAEDRFKSLQDTIEQTMLNSANAIADFAVSGRGSVADIGRAFAQDVLRLIIVSPVQKAAKEAAETLAKTFASIDLAKATQGGASFNWLGLFSGFLGLFGGGGSAGGGIAGNDIGLAFGKRGAPGSGIGVAPGAKGFAVAPKAAGGATFVDNSVIHVNGDVSPKTIQMIEASQRRTKGEILRSMRTGGAFANG